METLKYHAKILVVGTVGLVALIIATTPSISLFRLIYQYFFFIGAAFGILTFVLMGADIAKYYYRAKGTSILGRVADTAFVVLLLSVDVAAGQGFVLLLPFFAVATVAGVALVKIDRARKQVITQPRAITNTPL